MRITQFEPAAASAADLDGYVAVGLAAARRDRPDEPAPSTEAAIARLTRVPAPGRRHAYWVARQPADGQIVAVAYLNLVGEQPADLAAIDITVHPGHRRRGLGTALLRELALAAADRDCLLIEGLLDGSPGQAWADVMGFAVVQQTVELRLNLRSADPARWRVPAAAGYRLAEWTGGAPDELLLSYAAARNAIREAPHGDLSFTEPEWTAQRVRDEESTAAARRCELRVVAAIHQPTAQVAGLTYLEVYQQRPELAVQQDTAVLQAHRGHGLGVWMKAANLRRLSAAHPQVTDVVTSNAADNEHMLRVNQQVGFQPQARTEIREARLPDLAARLLRLSANAAGELPSADGCFTRQLS
jgi:mycothiol synthase